MSDRIQILKGELAADPLGRGYAAMSDVEAAADLNTVYRTRMRDTLSSAEIYEATVASEFQALGDVQKQYIRDVWGLGSDVSIGTDSKARAVYLQLFGAGSSTIAALLAVRTVAISRGDELGLGEVKPGHVQMAREA